MASDNSAMLLAHQALEKIKEDRHFQTYNKKTKDRCSYCGAPLKINKHEDRVCCEWCRGWQSIWE